MQIMPTINLTSNTFDSALKFSFVDYNNTQNFEDFLNAEEENEEEESKTEKVQNTTDVYAHTTNGYTYTLDEVCFTQTELSTLYKQLESKGAPTASLQGLKKLTELPGGANLGQVIRSLKTEQNTELSDEDANEITSLLNNIDPSGVLGNKVLDAIYNDNPHQALRHILDSLDEMDQTEQISFSKSELLALGRGLGLNDANQQKLAALFNDKTDNATLNPQGFSKALSPAQEQLLSEKNNKKKLSEALNQTLTPMLNKAHERMNKEAAASNLKNREADHSQVMIDKTVQEHSRFLLNSILDDANDRLQEDSRMQMTNVPRSQLDILRQNSVEAQLSANDQNDFLDKHDHHHKNSSWDELLHKVTFNNNTHSSHVRNDQSVQSFVLNTTQSTFNMASSQNFAKPNGQNIPISQHVVEQVETGLFSTLKNGASKLELQLHPQELGTIAITLVSRNGEVSAHIRSNNEQTVEMLNKQAEMIKTNLENQGIHVDKIEVELKDQAEAEYQNWQNMDQHNSFQEEDERRNQLRRLRNLANIESDTSDSGDLEQHMQEDGHTENNATRVLDKVA